MCFSATASFAAAGLLGVIGAASLAARPAKSDIPYALIPLIFAAHQAIEGAIWLNLSEPDGPPTALISAYLFIAKVFWPVFTPLAVLCMEQDRRRRAALWLVFLAGLSVAITLGLSLLNSPPSVEIVRHRLHYSTAAEIETQLIGVYMLATIAPLLISHHRLVMAFGGVVLLSALATDLFFRHASASVWCFFAAIGSVLVYWHVRRRGGLWRGKISSTL